MSNWIVVWESRVKDIVRGVPHNWNWYVLKFTSFECAMISYNGLTEKNSSETQEWRNITLAKVEDCSSDQTSDYH